MAEEGKKEEEGVSGVVTVPDSAWWLGHQTCGLNPWRIRGSLLAPRFHQAAQAWGELGVF